MKTINKIFFGTLVLALSGCFGAMDVEPADPLTFLADDFYSSADAYRSGLAGVYANLTLTGADGAGSSNITGLDPGTSQYGRGLWNLQELTTDEVVWSWENDPGLRELNRNTWTAQNVILRGVYGRVMTSVAFANEFLRQSTDDLLNERSITGNVRDEMPRMRAEARFLRALSYYHLLDLFGKAAYVTENDPVGAYQAPQLAGAELFEYIESELLAILPALADPLANEYARADRAAAWMLLAKLYLNAEVYTGTARYADCLNYCEQVIGSGFDLTPNYLDNFKADNHTAPARNEIIFSVVSDGLTSQNYGPTTVMINGQVGSLELNGADFGINAGGWGGALRVTRQFSETMMRPEYSTDDRNTLITDDRPIDIMDISQNGTGFIIAKWSNRSKDGTNGSALEIVDTDFPMFRLADAYLMYAEAHLRGGGGNAATALGYVNALRARANNPVSVAQNELTLDLILRERLVELHWEAHRRQDLLRFGRYTGGSYNWNWKGNAMGGIPIADFRKLFPLPAASLAANPNLKQNPGY